MDKKELDQMRTLINEEIEKTILTISETKTMTKPIAPENAIGRISRMEAIQSKSVAEAALRESESKLNNLKYMLTRIGDSEYGYCAKCRQAIPLGRMIRVPQSRFCVKCAS